MLLQKAVASPLLSAGGTYTFEFGEFVNLVSAAVSFAELFAVNTVYGVSWAITNNNTVVVTVKTQPLNAPGAWANPGAVTLSNFNLTAIVDGE